MKKQHIWRVWIAAGTVLAVSTVGSLMAYFTDTQEKVNFLTVEIPCRELITVNADGMKNPPGMTPLYSYEQDASWKHLGSCKALDEKGKQTGVKHLYAYAEASGKCRIVKPKETTLPLFHSVTFANVLEGQGLEEQEFTIDIQAYGIQTANLNGGTSDAMEIWQILSNQKEIPEHYQK